MIYTPLTRKALIFAYNAHHGQLDKAGVPYICHPLHLAEQMTDELTTCAALLHDVVEDTPITLEKLAEGFPPEVVEIVHLLTHVEGTDYLDYVRAVKAHPAARAVKLADLAHNGDETRWAGTEFDPEWQKRHREKYRRAKAILEDREP